jgi:anti-sigma regulatory factor (Ser/Thr protein kinase)
MTWSASLLIRNDVAELSRMAAWIEAWATQHDVADQTAQRIDLCAAEAVTNVMTHGARPELAGEVELRIGQSGDDVVFEIEDGGIAFDPTQAPLPAAVTMDCDRVGGWGMRIVRNLSDEVRYHRIGERNRLTLIFHPRPTAAA